MAGTEIFGKEEIMAAADVIERRMIHRYGSHAARAGVYRAEKFEAAAKEITGSKYALAVSSGTAALITALKGIGVKPGDEMITTPFTFIATIEAIVACDAVPNIRRAGRYSFSRRGIGGEADNSAHKSYNAGPHVRRRS